VTEEGGPAGLHEAVLGQAASLVRGDLSEFASYALPKALAQLYSSGMLGTPRSFEVLDVGAAGEEGHSEVRFRGSPDFTLRCTWIHTEGRWRASRLMVPEESVHGNLVSRALRLWRRKAPVPQREDLS
jgi:hypothetical protein